MTIYPNTRVPVKRDDVIYGPKKKKKKKMGGTNKYGDCLRMDEMELTNSPNGVSDDLLYGLFSAQIEKLTILFGLFPNCCFLM